MKTCFVCGRKGRRRPAPIPFSVDQVVGLPFSEGREAVQAVIDTVATTASSSPPTLAALSLDDGDGDGDRLEAEVYALVLGLRALLVAYGEDGGKAMFEVHASRPSAFMLGNGKGAE